MNNVSNIAAQFAAAASVTERPTLPQPSSDSVEAFHAALEQPELSPRGDRPIAFNGGGRAEDGWAAGLVPISNGILSGMGQLSVNFDHAVKSVVAVADGASSRDVRSAEWLKVQLALSAVTLQYDIATKVVGKVAQTLDTFLKSQ
ncbi:EscI/YscI/HrpB family type III secretion system inner rod protein [Bradyrhizobium genosp. P]|uniref:EscI/YscI/HrpB family type III secretion system inner rod protein n=1 Tax=Bradyrhizobium genosp. P TaxID=83641 RepID=UPI003CF95306